MIYKDDFLICLTKGRCEEYFNEITNTPNGKQDLQEMFGDKFLELINFGNQNNPWHCHDLLIHTTKVVDYIVPTEDEKETLKLKLAALFHDIGKVDTVSFNQEKQYNNFPNHPEKSVEIARPILENLNDLWNLDFNEKDLNETCWLIRNHDLFLNIHNQKQAEDLLLIAKDLKQAELNYPNYKPIENDYRNLFNLARADALGHNDHVYLKNKQGEVYELKEGGRYPWAYRIETINRNLDEELYIKVFEIEKDEETYLRDYYPDELQYCLAVELDNLYRKNENNLSKKELDEFYVNIKNLDDEKDIKSLDDIWQKYNESFILKEMSKKENPKDEQELLSIQARESLIEGRRLIDDLSKNYEKDRR